MIYIVTFAFIPSVEALDYLYSIQMSRIIIKNVPKVFTQKEIVGHFSKVDEITDCKVARGDSGESRRFAFVGFKNRETAEMLKQKYDNTYLGASKIRIEIARGREEIQQERSRTREKPQREKKDPKEEKVAKTFEGYKKIIQEQTKKSWDDLLVPQQPAYDPEEEKAASKHKSKKKVETPETPPVLAQLPQKKEKPIAEDPVKPIKAPRLSQKNKKFVTKPLQVDSNRLYITNIPYKLTQQEIKTAFSRFGNITKIKLPKQYDGNNKGFFFITYQKSQEALRAFAELDNKVVFGRIIHIKPSLEDIGEMIKTGKEAEYQEKIKEKYGETIEEKSSYKKKKKREMRDKLNDTTTWNTLFLNPNTILQRMAKKLHITKSEILLSDNLAPKVALAEAEVIQQTKEWMTKEGINLDFLQKDRNLCERSKQTLLIKNLNYRTQDSQLKQLLQFYGMIQRLLIAPNRAIAIAQFQNPEFAQNVMKNLQNHKFKNNFIYLQYAPLGMVDEANIAKKIEKMEKEVEEAGELSKVVYIKNLNFQTEEGSIYEIFEKIGPLKYAKIVKNKHGKSMGFGFVELQSSQKALEAIKRLNNVLVDGHKLILSLSRKKVQNVEELKALKEKIQKQEAKNSKLLVKNLAFQATKNELKELFSEYGNLKKIRLPKKMDGQHRGFAFIEFDTVEEAALAKSALSSAHLYGRKLVIQYQKGTKTE